MNKYLSVLKQEIMHWKSLMIIALVAFLYTAFPVYALNYRYAEYMLTSKLGFFVKVMVLVQMLEALGTAFTRLDVALMILTGFLVGINIVLLIQISKQLKQLNSPVRLMIGGSGVVGLFSAGCASCGLSFASVFGISTSFGFLPYGNKLLYILAIGISLYSIYFMIGQINKSKSCTIRTK